jgi:flagellar assembly factor FliW
MKMNEEILAFVDSRIAGFDESKAFYAVKPDDVTL